MSRIKRVISPRVNEPPPELWSNCLVVDGVVYISGLTGRSSISELPEHAGEYEQARVIFEKMDHLVRAAGGQLSDVVRLTIYVTDVKQRKEVWRARREFFRGDFPTCSLVQVAALADPTIKVEIEAVAHIGAS